MAWVEVIAMFVLACTAAESGDTTRGPIILDGKNGATLTGVRVASHSGSCITVRNVQTFRIENVEVGPCGGHGIEVSSSSKGVITNSYIHHTHKNGVDIYNSRQIQVTRNRIDDNSAGVYAQDSSGIVVDRNQFRNMQGPGPRGQFVQFNQVTGPGNRISCNRGENVSGQSAPEDAINLFASHGEPSDPIQVIGNRIRGGGPSPYGGGILLGDGGGSWQIARENVLVDPGQYGVAVAGGHDVQVLRNKIFARRQSFTNVGIYVWNQYDGLCSRVMVLANSVDWTGKDNKKNARWSAGNCGAIAGWDDNNWGANLADLTTAETPKVCGGNGR